MTQLTLDSELIPERKKAVTFYSLAREEAIIYGADKLDLTQLLALVLGKSASSALVGAVAGLGVANLSRMSIQEFQKITGITELMASKLYAVFEIGRRTRTTLKEKNCVVKCPEDAANLFWYLNDCEQEVLAVAFLNTKNQVIARKEIFKGSLNASIVHPREIFREAVKLSAASIICAHQHPSGDPKESREDINVTERIVSCGKMMGIELLDHVIIGDGRFVSLKEKGHI